MPLQEERTGWGVWFFLFLFHTPIYTNGCGDSIPKTMCRKKRHIYIVMFFRMKILICSKPAVIDKFNLLADTLPSPSTRCPMTFPCSSFLQKWRSASCQTTCPVPSSFMRGNIIPYGLRIKTRTAGRNAITRRPSIIQGLGVRADVPFLLWAFLQSL